MITGRTGTAAESGIGTEAEISHAKTNSGGLGLFLRSLVGLDREAAAAAFGKFQEGKTFTSVQLRFVNEVIYYLAHNGTINVDFLYRSPFNSIPLPPVDQKTLTSGGPGDQTGPGTGPARRYHPRRWVRAAAGVASRSHSGRFESRTGAPTVPALTAMRYGY